MTKHTSTALFVLQGLGHATAAPPGDRCRTLVPGDSYGVNFLLEAAVGFVLPKIG